MALRLTDDGTLDLSSVEELSSNALSDWIRARLHGEDDEVPENPRQNAGSYYLVGAIYEGLRPETQEEVRRILKRFLRQMAEGDPDWRGEHAHSLLLVVIEIGERELSPHIRQMAERGQFADDEDLHARLLQALLYLDEKATSGFWKRQAERDSVRYAALAFSGLLMHSPDVALGFLKELDLSIPEVRDRLYPAIRGLLASKRYDRVRLHAVLNDMRKFFPEEEAYTFVVEALPELDMAAEASNQETDRYSEVRTVLGSQGYAPEPASLGYGDA